MHKAKSSIAFFKYTFQYYQKTSIVEILTQAFFMPVFLSENIFFSAIFLWAIIFKFFFNSILCFSIYNATSIQKFKNLFNIVYVQIHKMQWSA